MLLPSGQVCPVEETNQMSRKTNKNIKQYITNVSCLTGELGKQMFKGVKAVEFYSSVIEFHKYNKT